MNVVAAARVADTGVGARPRTVAFVALLVAFLFNAADRQLLAILQEPIAAELHLSDTMLGMLSLSFAVAYALASFPLAALADRGWLKTVVVGTLATWSLLTAACGAAWSFTSLALLRAGVAIGESGCTPATHAMIARIYPPERRAFPFAILLSVGVAGSAAAYGIGGWIAAHAGWRAAFYALGGAGLVLTPLVWLGVGLARAEPPPNDDAMARAGAAHARQDADAPRLVAVAAMFWRLRSLRYLATAAALNGTAGYGFGQWMGSYLVRVHGLDLAAAGGGMFVVSAVTGIAGAMLAGVLTDRLAGRDDRAYAVVPGVLLALSVPAAATLVLAPSAMVALGTYGACHLAVMATNPSIFALVQRMASAEARATAAAMIVFLINLAGMSLGPLLFGIASDLLGGIANVDALRGAFAVGAVCLALAAGCCALAARNVRRDLAAV